MTHHHAPVTIRRFISPWDAHVVRGRLESEGIPAWLANEQHVWANWSLSHALGGVGLVVPQPAVAEAEAVLAALDAGQCEAALCEELDVAPEACENCGATDLEPVKSIRSITLAVTMLAAFGVTFPPHRSSRKRCRACGHR